MPCGAWPVAARCNAEGRQIGSGPHVLTKDQLALFDKAKEECEFPLGDEMRMTDEDLLMRYFIGRDFKVDEAVAAARNSVKWRKDNDVENCFLWANKTMPEKVIFKSHTRGLCGFYGFDIEGYPIWWERPNQDGINELLKQYGRDECLKWHVCVVERCREVAKTLRVDRVTMVLDLSDVSGSVLFSKAGGLLKAQAKQDQEVYPECLRKMFLINAPWGFSSAWSVLKPFLNARTQEKITIQSTRAPGDPLSAYITPENIPTDFGGTGVVDWDVTRMMPLAEKNIFKPKMYVEVMKRFEAEEKEEEEKRQKTHHHHHHHHNDQDSHPDVAHTDVLVTCLTYLTEDEEDGTLTPPPTPPPNVLHSGVLEAAEEPPPPQQGARCCCSIM